MPAELLDAIAELVERRVLERLAAVEAAPEWLSVETAAGYLDVSAERVRKLVARRARSRTTRKGRAVECSSAGGSSTSG